MPINPALALQVKGFELPDPMAQMAQATQIQNALQQQRMGDIQMQNALRQQQQQRKYESIVAGFAPNMPIGERVRALQTEGLASQAAQLAKTESELSEQQRKEALAGVNLANAKAEIVARYFPNVEDQNSYSQARLKAIATGQVKPTELPEQYDKNFVDALLKAGVSLKDQIANVFREREVGARETSAKAAQTQAMTARDRFEWEKANPNFTIQDTAQGLMKVDKRTGAMSPLTMGGQPVMGRTAPQIIQGPEGPMVVQPDTGTARPVVQTASPGGAATPVGAPLTSSEREWRNAVARGETNQSFTEWKKQTQPKQFESTVDVERARFLQDEAKKVSTSADSASRQLPALEVQSAILDSGFRTGWGAGAQQAAFRVLSAFGVSDAKKYSAQAETFLSQSMAAVNDKLAEQKGAQSDSDAKRATQIATNLGNTPEANQFLIKLATATAKNDIAKKSFYETWFRTHKTYEGVDEAWRAGPGSKSIFDSPDLASYKAQLGLPVTPTSVPQGPVIGGRSATPRGTAPAAAAPSGGATLKFDKDGNEIQ